MVGTIPEGISRISEYASALNPCIGHESIPRDLAANIAVIAAMNTLHWASFIPFHCHSYSEIFSLHLELV
jgi:hypothetical protein